MTSPNASGDDFDRLMSRWMEADARTSAPDDLVERVIEHATATRQISRWLLPERWLSMQLTTRFQAVPRLAPPVLFLAVLLIALVAAVAIIGSRPKVPAPFGPAANGRIAYESGGQIVTVEPDGSGLRRLTDDPHGAASPLWSHDGTRLTYKALTQNEPTNDPTLYGDLVVVAADGSRPISIEAGRTGMSPGNWSPDGRSIVYSYETSPGHDAMFIAPADGSSPPARIGDATTSNWGPSWSPDGSRIAYVCDNSVCVVGRDGSNVTKVTGRYPEQSGVSWSPDGKQLVFSAGEPGRHDIWRVGLDGLPERQIAAEDASEDSPSYSPDGARIAFLRGLGAGATQVVVSRSDGSDVHVLPGTYGWLGVTWSPDGKDLIVGDSRTEPIVFYLLDPDGSAKPQRLDLATDQAPPALARLQELPAWQRVAR